MKWKWVMSVRAVANLSKLPNDLQLRIIKKIKFWIETEEPLSFAERLHNFEIGSYRFRVGDYRITFDVDGLIIKVLKIDHRRDVYK